MNTNEKKMSANITHRLNYLSGLNQQFRQMYHLTTFNKALSQPPQLDGDEPPSMHSSSGSNKKRNLIHLERILLCDDDPEQRLMMSDFLQNEFQAEVVSTENGSQANQHLLSEQIINLVILDLNLGETENGLELGQKLRSFEPTIPYLIISSTKIDQIEEEKIINAGFDFAIKETNVVRDKILSIFTQVSDLLGTDRQSSSTDSFIRDLGMTAFSSISLQDSLNRLL